MIILRKLHLYLILTSLCLMVSCTIQDDLPYPLVKAEVVNIILDGQCDEAGTGFAPAIIDKEKRTVDVYVDDRVDVSALYIKKFEVSHNARIHVEGTNISFTSEYSPALPFDFSRPVTFRLTTYQDYTWKVRVHQIILREVEVENQVGEAIIDETNRNVIVYVSPTQKLSKIRVKKMQLGGQHGTTSPNVEGQEVDFTFRREFQVRYAYSNTPKIWNVFIYNAEQNMETTVEIFPHATKAFAKGNMQNGTTPTVEYRKADSGEDWTTLFTDKVQTTSTSFTAALEGLLPGTDYECRVQAGGSTSDVQHFTTASAQQLENASLDTWHIKGTGNKALYCPWAEGGTSYWDTGNHGATTVGASNSTFQTDGERTYANLQSKYIVIKFAAGNIFTGEYLKTDGTNGILSFGRPFSSFPTHLQFDYKYQTSDINRGGGKWDDSYSRYISRQTYDGLRGQRDTCQVFIALIGDKDEEVYQGTTYPFIVRTRPSELKLFNPDDDNVIAFAQMSQGNNIQEWTTETLSLQYRYTDRTPKYIIVVASSSKYGDYFIGCDESLLQLDNMKLLYQ